MWIGHVTPTTAEVTLRILNVVSGRAQGAPSWAAFYGLRYWSTDPNNYQLTDAKLFSNNPTSDFRKFTLTNLQPGQKYYISAVYVTGEVMSNGVQFPIPNDGYTGTFTTPYIGAHSFAFGFGSCSRSCPPLCDSENLFNTSSNSFLYQQLLSKAQNSTMQFFIHLGDMHYRDIAVDNTLLYIDAYNSVFSSTRQNLCWRNLPMYYMWDDHDYGPNDSDKTSVSRLAAFTAYTARVPSPTLPKDLFVPSSPYYSSSSPYYSFVRGRVRFIVTDTRSQREPKGAYPSTSPSQQVFSAAQKAWFFNEMLTAKNNNQIIVWANTFPWIAPIENGRDDWGGYHYARMEIVNFINANSLADRIVMISGDMHALAYDDGSSVNNYGNLKVCHAGPLDEQNRSKGGPYAKGPHAYDSISQGTYNGSPIFTTNNITNMSTQYGMVDIGDTGTSTINVRYRGIIVNKSSPYNEVPIIDQNFNLNAGGSSGSLPSAGLVAFWNLDNATGAGAVPAQFGNFILNALNNFNTSTQGVVQNAYFFNGSSQGLWTNQQITNQITNPTSFSVSFWVKFDNGSAVATMMGNAFGSMRFHFDNYGSSSGYDGLGISFRILVGPGYTWRNVSMGTAPLNNTWYHVVGTYDLPTTTMRLYINGVLVGSNNTASFNTAPVNPTWHGFALNGSVYPNGKEYGSQQYYDALGFWNKKLESTEVSLLYNNGSGIQFA